MRRRWRCGLLERTDVILPRPARLARGPADWSGGWAPPCHPETSRNIRPIRANNHGAGRWSRERRFWTKIRAQEFIQRRGELKFGSARRHATMGWILKIPARIKIGKRHRPAEGQQVTAAAPSFQETSHPPPADHGSCALVPINPPSTGSMTPFTIPARADNNHSIASAMSSGSASRPSGTDASIGFTFAGSAHAALPSAVSTTVGHTAFVRIP